MAEIVLNRFNIELKELPTEIYFFTENELQTEKYYLARYKPTRIIQGWPFLADEIKNWLNNFVKEEIKEEEYVYISFFMKNYNYSKKQNIKFMQIPHLLQKKYLKELFIRLLVNHYIIEPTKEGVGVSIYSPINTKKGQYQRFDFIFNIYFCNNKNLCYEAVIGVGSTNTFLLQLTPSQKSILAEINKDDIKFVKDNLLIRNESEENIEVFDYLIKANSEIRALLGLTNTPKKKFYREYYELINNIVKEISPKIEKSLKLHTQYTAIKKVNIVSFEKNKMVFKNKNQDYSTVNGMRDFGPYNVPENAKNTQLLFIYPDKESANKLYTYLLRGFKHFPGLESYVGIPANIYEKKINYGNDLNSIFTKLDNELTEQTYSNILAVCIMPFSKSIATKEQRRIYFQIKEKLLKKNIPSQFIHRNKIFEENFHFNLPNIAIAMLSKCGGIPWKLATPYFNQLTIGFNIFRTKDDKNTFLGSAVFFDNEGIIREVNGYKKGDISNICQSLINSINKYKEVNFQKTPNKVVIHFYKNVGGKELKQIEKIIKNELGKDSAFAIVEINDTKSSIELCFDLNYESFMPQSGTYIELKKNEYLLFNNLRYWEKPINPIYQEELPIKIRIYDPYNSFSHHVLISQVYEFSRMYWKSLKQKAQPVTIIYSKLIAEYLAEFCGQLPDNEVTKRRVWFI